MITDNFLNEIAKGIAGDSFVVPTHMAFGSSVIVATATDTVLAGEFGSRVSLTDARNANAVTFTGTRLGSGVATSAGDTLNAMALLSSSANGTLLSETSLASIIHTTAYDLEVQWKITVSRG